MTPQVAQALESLEDDYNLTTLGVLDDDLSDLIIGVNSWALYTVIRHLRAEQSPEGMAA